MEKNDAVSKVIHDVVEVLDSIMGLIFFVRDEIKELEVPDDVREDVLAVTSGFENLYYFDIRKEVNNLGKHLAAEEPHSGSVKYAIAVIRDDLAVQLE